MIDLRSDTVTRPTDAMRAAMAAAAVGDDVFGDDPTVNELEAAVADRLGKEAAALVTSGTQGNLCALLAHCQRGDEYIVGDRAHTYKYEGGGGAVLGSIQPQPVPIGDDGMIDLDRAEAAVKPDDSHFARTRLLCLENTIDGKALTVEQMQRSAALAARHGLGHHLDGARLWNAAAALGEDPAAVAAPFDSVSVCLSKGLGAPVGSVLAGSAGFVAEARKWRKMLGGGCARPGWWPRPASTPSTTTSSGWPTTTPTRPGWPGGWSRSPEWRSSRAPPTWSSPGSGPSGPAWPASWPGGGSSPCGPTPGGGW